MAVQAGFVVGTLVSALLNLPDVLNARRLFQIGCVAGALANASLLLASSPLALIALRTPTGAALAWVYPPAMKVAAGWFRRSDHRLAMGLPVPRAGPFLGALALRGLPPSSSEGIACAADDPCILP